jgi:hypothetical protein
MTTRVCCTCRQNKPLVDYVKAKNPENLPFLWVPVQGGLPENGDPEKFLSDPDNALSLEAHAVLARGGNGFLQKPFSLEQVSRTMRAILDGKDTVSHG